MSDLPAVGLNQVFVPLGISSVAATRFGFDRLADGLAEVRLDVALAETGTQIQGRAVIERFNNAYPRPVGESVRSATTR